MNNGWTYRDRVDQRAAGETVVGYYTRRYQHSTAAQWRDRVAAGQILVDGRAIASDAVLEPGQVLSYCRPPWHEPTVPLDFRICHEDADLWVVAKPSGLPVMPAGGFLDHTLLGQLRRRYPTETPVPIHRLGRGTSGLVLLARSPRARAELTRQLRDREMDKIYWAIAAGTTDHTEFAIAQPIGKIPHPTLGHLYGATADGRDAHSHCSVLQRDRDRLLLEVQIFTGRPHQIRIHLASVGLPLVGDPLYTTGGIPNAIARPGDGGYCLHAHTLRFVHPRSRDRVEVSHPAPFSFP